MINLKTGELKFDEILITPNMKLSDFQKLNNVECDILGNGKGLIYVSPLITSNGIDAKINIEIFERYSKYKITIYPIPDDINANIFELSKIWFKGQAVGKYREFNNRIIGRYHWGNVLIKDNFDCNYGCLGGEINIIYQKN